MRVIHVFRAPVGGLFRHVCDLVKAQSQAGVETGIVCDDLTGGDYASKLIAEIGAYCPLGIVRLPMPRMPAMSDFATTRKVAEIATSQKADILHGHGSKGGLHARLAGSRLGIPSVYTPHGGVLNYSWTSPSGALFLGTEKYLARRGSGFAFVCDYERRTFEDKIGTYGKPHIVVHNGLWPEEFTPVKQHADASDLVFAGEMRYNKGVDLLLEAVAEVSKSQPVTLTLAGDGPQIDEYKALSQRLGIQEATRFIGRVPILKAFASGRIFVSPSRFESFPYVIMEAIAAEIPVISTNVGGISEVLPASMLTRSVDVSGLVEHLRRVLADEQSARESARQLSLSVKATTTATEMMHRIVGLYRNLGVVS